jgi:hypothetical protein
VEIKLVRVSHVNKVSGFPFSSATLFKWRHLGRYPGLFVKFGGALFVDLTALEKLIEDNRLSAKPRPRKDTGCVKSNER